MWVHTKKTQDQVTPETALEYLKEGNQRFINNLKINRNLLQQVNQTSEGQFPFAAILSCIDSRTSAEIIFDQGLGDIFSIRIAGNILNDDILGSMEYACNVAGSKLIVVLGHNKCAAITSACNDYRMGYFTGLLDKLKPAINEESVILTERNGSNAEFINKVSINNVIHTIKQIRGKSKILCDLENIKKIRIAGAFYNVDTGVVTFMPEL